MVIGEALSLLERREAELILCHILNMNMTELILNRNKILSDIEEERYLKSVKRRKSGEPVQYIIGSSEFMSLEFLVDNNVLIPRSDTETLVENVIDILKDKNASVLDIGTGSGCIGISLLKYCPKITAECVDISSKALEITQKNAEKNGVLDRIKLTQMDILKEIPDGKYDVLVSNPPYIRPDVIEGLECQVKDFEPYQALYGGEDGLLFYKRITDIAPLVLNRDGILAFEIGYDQGESVSGLLKANFSDIEIIKDLCDNDRVVLGKLKRT